MKKKIPFIIVISLLLCFLIAIVGVALIPDKKNLENQQYVDEQSKIETFINSKTELNCIIVARIKSNGGGDLDYSYHIDDNDELYTLLATMEYEEINSNCNDLSSLYDIGFVSKTKIQSAGGYPRTFKIMTDYKIKTSADIFSDVYSKSKERLYEINKDDYNKLIDKIEYILENCKIY